MATYTFDIPGDFPGLTQPRPESSALLQEILDGGLTEVVDYINTSPSTLSVFFPSVLSGGDETLLNAIIAAHTGEPLPDQAALQEEALVGTSGQPSASNPYVTDQDNRIADKVRYRTVSVDGVGTDFSSVKDAVDWVAANGTPSASNPWVIQVYPGLYTEDPFTIPAYVLVMGTGAWVHTQLSTTDNNANFVTLAAGAAIQQVNLVGPTAVGFAAIDYTGTGTTPGFVDDVVIRTGYYGVNAHSASAGTLHLHNVVNRYNGSQIHEFIRVSDSSNITALDCSFMSGPPDAVVKGFRAVGAGASLTADNCQFRNSGSSTQGFCCESGATMRLNGCHVAQAAKGIHAVGTNATVFAAGCSISPSVTVSIETTDATARVFFSGVFDDDTTDLADPATLASIGTDETGTVVRGQLLAGADSNRVHISEFLREAGQTGLVSGGVVSRDSGLDVTVGSGTGFIAQSGTSLKPVSWVSDTFTFSANQPLIYLYVDASGTLTESFSEPDFSDVIVLARAATGASSILFLASLNLDVTNSIAKRAVFHEEAIGILNVSGCATAQHGGSPSLQYSVTSGEYFHMAQKVLASASAAPCSFRPVYRDGASGWVYGAAATSLDPNFYDNNSGILVAVPAGKYVRHLGFEAVNGSGTEFFVVYGQAHFDSQILATSNPQVPEELRQHAQRHAAFILQQGNNTIQAIVDERPRNAQLATSTTSSVITVHNDLTGRDSLTAHTQYQLLSEKGAASGYAPLNGSTKLATSFLTLSAVAGATCSAAAGVAGTGDPATSTHTHQIATAAPTTGIGGGNSAGSGDNLARADHNHALRTTAGGGTDLTIGSIADGEAIVRSGTTLVGTSLVALTSSAPANVTKAAAAVGVATTAARADHKHDVATAAPSTGIGAGNTEGSSSSLARADHNHTIRESGGQDLTMGAVSDGQFLRRSGTALVGVASIYDPRDALVRDHFLSGNHDSDELAVSGWRIAATGTGNAQNITGEVGHPGILNLAGGTGLNARSAVDMGNGALAGIQLGSSGNPLVYEALVSFRVSLSNTAVLRHQFGIGDGWALTNPNPLTDGIYFRFEPNLSGSVVGVVRASSVETTRTLFTPTLGNWYRLGFTHTPSGTPSVQFIVNGTNTGAAVTTTIPSARIGPGFRADASGGGGGNPELWVDYLVLTQVTLKET